MHGGTSQAGELGHHTQPGTSSPHLTWNIQTTGFWPSTVTPVSPASASSMRHLQGKGRATARCSFFAVGTVTGESRGVAAHEFTGSLRAGQGCIATACTGGQTGARVEVAEQRAGGHSRVHADEGKITALQSARAVRRDALSERVGSAVCQWGLDGG